MIGENKRCPFCTAGIIMPEEHEAKLPTIEHDNGCFLRRYREIGFTPEDLKRWNTRSPIANNGVSLEDIVDILEDVRTKSEKHWHGAYTALSIDQGKAIIAKLQPTAPRGAGEERS